jgi:NADPH-dependent ferric siderophore reductase
VTDAATVTLTGVAIPSNPVMLLDEFCEHFVEHAEVERMGNSALLRSEEGTASIRVEDGKMLFKIIGPSAEAVQLSRNSIAEHLFYFAGDEQFELTWDETALPTALPNLHFADVVRAEDVTPHMRRVIFSCADLTPFINGDMHVRVLVPPQGREPVWPRYSANGRIGWPEGDDALVVRPYTIRSIDKERNELAIDFFQHPEPGITTPGADFARDAVPGMRVGLLGPGSGGFPEGDTLFLAGDESGLPAIVRIIEEAPAGTTIKALIEVIDAAEEQPLPTAAALDVTWRHRSDPRNAGPFSAAIEAALADVGPEAYIWVACEKVDIRAVRAVLKRRDHDRRIKYVAWYWERNPDGLPD